MTFDALDLERMRIFQSVVDKETPGIRDISGRPDLMLVVWLLDRVMQERRSRWEPEIGETLEQQDDWRERLREKFPAMDAGYDHGPGWADLLAAGAQMAADAGEELRVSYAKEKYGRLSLFTSSYFEGDLAGLDDALETLSEHICEECGAPGRNRSVRGWWRTTCDKHTAEGQR